MQAAALRTIMLRMNVITSESLDESGNELRAGGRACMYVKPYDTEAVPQDKHECRQLYETFSCQNVMLFSSISNSNNLQNYKIFSKNMILTTSLRLPFAHILISNKSHIIFPIPFLATPSSPGQE